MPALPFVGNPDRGHGLGAPAAPRSCEVSA